MQARKVAAAAVLVLLSAASHAFTPAGTSPDISLAGATPVPASVSSAGSAAIEVPIQAVPGTAGMQPELALTYAQHTSGSIFQDVLHPGGSGGFAQWGRGW